MYFSDKRNLTRWIIIIASFFIVSLILWNTYTFFQIFKNEERLKMQVWAAAQKSLLQADLENDNVDLNLEILSSNQTIPLIKLENNVIISHANIDESVAKDSISLYAFLNELKKQNEPIKIEYDQGKSQYVYYGDSALITKLKYYPVALFLIIVLFATVVYNFYRSTKMATQNKLWAGMAKETAHQIGTPLSSLIGWLEIMKADNVDATTINEIEKDINRLQTITDRFSKIGSEPILSVQDIVAETQQSFDYLKDRFSKQIAFHFKAPKTPVMALLNPELHSWTIENLMKNAVDAMKGKGVLKINIEVEGPWIKINVSDSGKGIPKKQFKKIFEPGFTTKRRGWGLGLSLTKRIVEDYHKGKIRVLQSEIDKGTTIQISLKTVV
ncbi:MAG: HAMP domain-containing histidine kinase [Flavobacterium sp.]|nr:HAMP domain-containing histidine kinase [Flavobacterium sp.]